MRIKQMVTVTLEATEVTITVKQMEKLSFEYLKKGTGPARRIVIPSVVLEQKQTSPLRLLFLH
jgi:hypothetical protein